MTDKMEPRKISHTRMYRLAKAELKMRVKDQFSLDSLQRFIDKARAVEGENIEYNLQLNIIDMDVHSVSLEVVVDGEEYEVHHTETLQDVIFRNEEEFLSKATDEQRILYFAWKARKIRIPVREQLRSDRSVEELFREVIGD